MRKTRRYLRHQWVWRRQRVRAGRALGRRRVVQGVHVKSGLESAKRMEDGICRLLEPAGCRWDASFHPKSSLVRLGRNLQVAWDNEERYQWGMN
ncbi:hypothetical protein M404DRAFT_713773 [Pisolithus tinctorius Marx 270]|uniref:Uncharacterized protein n=1 Tax=Pisolithus tinctorius Marx 270 TaxID=870435 RepID=A0A0C3JXJ5_PISTI|nr:hypothetical protein M404DRAFT_713773 [Pisolithus tinctorius Marx 270]